MPGHRRIASLAALPVLAAAHQYSAGEVIPITLNGHITSITLPYSAGQSPILTAPATLTPTPGIVSGSLNSAESALSSYESGANSVLSGSNSYIVSTAEVSIVIPIVPTTIAPRTTNALSVLYSALDSTPYSPTTTITTTIIPSSSFASSPTPEPSITITGASTIIVIPASRSSEASSISLSIASAAAGAPGISAGLSSVASSARTLLTTTRTSTETAPVPTAKNDGSRLGMSWVGGLVAAAVLGLLV